MGISGKNKHYKIAEIQPRHFLSMAESLGLKKDLAEKKLQTLAEKSEMVIEKVAAQLPHDFPKEISAPIFESIKKSLKKFVCILNNKK